MRNDHEALISPDARRLSATRVTAADRELAPGEVGEIVARGPTVLNGYIGHGERRMGAWHRTNDLGRREQDGSITFIGPKARLIKSAAENIYPAEVEAWKKDPQGCAREKKEQQALSQGLDAWVEAENAAYEQKRAAMQRELEAAKQRADAGD